MGIRDKLRQLKQSSPSQGNELTKRRSSQSLTVPGQVTEETLQVWRALPAEIRHDPSMASFQMENERLHGSTVVTDDESGGGNEIEVTHGDDDSMSGSEFITIRTSPLGTSKLEKKPAPSDDELTHLEHEIVDPIAKKASDTLLLRKKRMKRYGLLVFWIFTTAALMMFNEKHLLEKTLEVPQLQGKYFEIQEKPTGDFNLQLLGVFSDTTNSFNASSGNFLIVQPQLSYGSGWNATLEYKNILTAWKLSLVPEELLDYAPVLSRNRTFEMPDDILGQLQLPSTKIRLHLFTNIQADIAVKLTYNPLIINVKTGTMLAALILLLFNSLLVWEVFERPFIAIVCSLLALGVCACFDDRPNMEEIIRWMDMEMLTLLFCMMIIVCILTETGVFDYIAVFAFEISGGKIWPMIYSLCFITCFVSSFLDNMTTVLLLTPVAIRLCEVMSLDPVPVLMGIIVHSNIGGSLTPIGDPISIIICSNHFIVKNGVTFMKFVVHTIPGVILTAIQSCIFLRFNFRKMNSLRLSEPKEIKELRREIKVWQRAANSVAACSKDADLVRATLLKKVKVLKHTLREKLQGIGSPDAYVHTLEDLKLKYPIKNKTLLMQASCSLAFVIICFFIQSVPHLRTLPLGWVALLGVIALLIVLNRDDMEHLLHRIEWTTLLFFAAMFVMMECVERLGLFTWIGELTENIILLVDKRQRLAVAIFIILWFSALASAFLDSIPVTAMMVKVVVSLVAKDSLGLPLEPLVWALAFGPCLGGNGTLYGASSNVISAGIAEQHGYKISFTRYLRIAFPMMVGQITIITAYLFVAHILFEWH